MSILDDDKLEELIKVAIDTKIEALAVPMIQSRLDKEIRVIIDKALTTERIKYVHNLTDKYLYKRINEEIKDKELTDRIDFDFIEQEIVEKVSGEVFKNLRVQLVKK